MRLLATGDQPGHGLRNSLDIARIADELGYRPDVPFEQGLADAFQGYRDSRARWRPLGSRSAADD